MGIQIPENLELWAFRFLKSLAVGIQIPEAVGIQIPENLELWAFRFLKTWSCGHSDS